MFSELQNLGLSQEEAKIYVACLEIGGGPVSVIAKKAGLHRVASYHTIEKLIEKKLLSKYNKNGIRCFAAEKPQKLIEITQEKLNQAKILVPELLSIINVSAFKPKIRFYEGKDGIETVFKESLGSKGEILGYSNLKTIIDFFPDFFRNYCSQKIDKKIKTRYLSTNNIKDANIIRNYYPKKYDENLLEVLLVNDKQFLFQNEVMIFNNSVGIISFKKEELMSVIIESSTFANTMKAVFDLAWLGATAFVAN